MPAAAEAPTAMGPPGQLSALREWEIQHDNELEEVARNEAKEKENRRQAAVDLIKIYHQEFFLVSCSSYCFVLLYYHQVHEILI